ncbi:uncharacterized protein LOC114299321 isoform X5 [Camellia sinensis]|uniref:uncharacterized protein LOC114299321 isoform X5 n=1 Tax=Camellia sinensis TaxID=4442 RepID=UPI001036A292|nr:uncharacterized protein LOC114299321 isoform X5 [Camellia sinensis]
MYDGKLINLISKKKGKNVDASNSLCSIRQERVQVAINEGKGPFWLDPACVNESPVEDKVYYNVKNFLSSLQCRLSSPSDKKCNRVSCSSYYRGFRCLKTYNGHPRPCDRSKWICYSYSCNCNYYRNYYR